MPRGRPLPPQAGVSEAAEAACMGESSPPIDDAPSAKLLAEVRRILAADGSLKHVHAVPWPPRPVSRSCKVKTTFFLPGAVRLHPAAQSKLLPRWA